MNAPQDITTAVNDMIEQFLASTGRCQTSEVVQAVVTSWSPPGGSDEDKWVHCAYMAISAQVGAAVRRFDVASDDIQLVLDGYEKLHTHYRVKGRDGSKSQLIRVDKLTVTEAMDVLAELDRCESGLRLHRNELQRYIDEVLIPAGNGN